ncbi:hypothetical protein BIY22_07505 [Vibrio panuliri]|uniref:Uncharacterized protein n=1 Tax=Vibrio panuliri TaxID=1381081 RepID=A0A1Q9HE58_9VIBR|nr:hypothetical protein [Vibrio panuliri]OLQ88013.1 hypothetical protein BIY22_07505 [Vibrio panuliri]
MIDSINPSTLHQIPDEVHAVLNQFGSYDDPCLVILCTDAKQEIQTRALDSAVKNNDCEASNWFHLEQNLSFCYLFCDHFNANYFAFDLSDHLSEQGYNAKVSLFRHNAIGDIYSTYRWNISQLLELLPTAEKVAINDFQDKHHWQGVSHYLAEDREAQFAKENAQSHGEPIASNEDIALPLQHLAPFIAHLPHGQALWNYVLNGEYQNDTLLQAHLVDLDSVLVLHHAKCYSPDFYRHILRCCHYDSIPAQHEILPYLADILRPLLEVLLPDNRNLLNQQRCLRVVEIFFHLFDQQDLPKELRSVLVQDQASACISAMAYEQRFSLPSLAEENDISAKTKQQINAIIDSLDHYTLCDYQDYQDIEQAFATNRHAYNYQLWQREEEDEQTVCRLIGAILLNFDRNAQRFDSYTEALLSWVSHGLYKDVFTQFEQLSQPTSARLQAWLIHGQAEQLPTLIEELKHELESDSNEQRDAQLGITQPKYSLFSSVGIFRPILATCYWLYNVNQDDFAKRVVILSAALAPQATIASIAHFYRQSLAGFASLAQQNTFFMHLFDIGISYIDQCAFHIGLAVRYDLDQLPDLIQRYVDLDQSERDCWNQAINKLCAYERDYFYLNVHRLHPALGTPLPHYRKIVLEQLISAVSDSENNHALDQLSHAAQRFIEGEISFQDYHSLSKDLLDTSLFDLPPDYYPKHAPKILPQILTADSAQQLRWIQLLCSEPAPSKLGWIKTFRRHTTHNEQLQATLLEHLFFEQCLHEGNLSFDDRQEIEIDDLTPDWLDYWQQYQRQMARKIKSH